MLKVEFVCAFSFFLFSFLFKIQYTHFFVILFYFVSIIIFVLLFVHLTCYAQLRLVVEILRTEEKLPFIPPILKL